MGEMLQSFLDQGTSFEGKVAFSGTVRIDGHFEGEASADGTLVIGESGSVEADLDLVCLIVHGSFKGTVKAKEMVEISPTGSVDGQVICPRLRVADGAQVSARVRMGESAPKT